MTNTEGAIVVVENPILTPAVEANVVSPFNVQFLIVHKEHDDTNIKPHPRFPKEVTVSNVTLEQAFKVTPPAFDALVLHAVRLLTVPPCAVIDIQPTPL
jgi:hypothetical protein